MQDHQQGCCLLKSAASGYVPKTGVVVPIQQMRYGLRSAQDLQLALRGSPGSSLLLYSRVSYSADSGFLVFQIPAPGNFTGDPESNAHEQQNDGDPQ